MPRATVGPAIDIQFQSPSEMVETLAPCLESEEPLVIDADAPLSAGVARSVVIRVPWLGRMLELKSRVLPLADGAPTRTLSLRLLDGPRDTLADLLGIIGKLRSGAILQDAPGDIPAEQRIRSMSPHLRAMLAARANAEERVILMREVDPRVLEFLLKNPSLTVEEVRRLASRLTLNHGHFAQIARNPAWMGDEMLRTILARNPRLPEFMAETVMTTLSTPALKGIVESANTTASTRRVSSRILQTRGVIVAKRRGEY